MKSPTQTLHRSHRVPLKFALLSVVVCAIPLLSVLWVGVFAQPVEPKILDPQQLQLLRRAERQLKYFQLTWPAGDNALQSYQAILQAHPASAEAIEGVWSVGERYLSALGALVDAQDFALAEQTLAAAQQLVPVIRRADYASRLDKFRAQLQADKASAESRRRQILATHKLKLVAHESFRDALRSGDKGPTMVVLPAGQFTLGSAADEDGRDNDEGPPMLVTIRPFALGAHEVTFAEYDLFARATGRALPKDADWGREQRPVINVSWLDARAYAVWLSHETGFRYRLPTEAEWEYVARAGSKTAYPTGSCLSSAVANIDFRVRFADCPTSTQFSGRTVPVDALAPNAWGIYNLYGNVREFTEDCWQLDYRATPADGSAYYAAEAGQCGIHADGGRMVRGGAWLTDMRGSRIANRYAIKEIEFGATLGFRVARDLD